MSELSQNLTENGKLLPCLFCGSEFTQVRYMGGKWQEPSAFSSGYRGECCDCGAITAAYDTEAEAIAAWNTRAEQTCRIDPIVKQVNGAEWTGFKCDTCLYWEVSPFAGLASAIGRFNYCPNCGARVVGE